MPAIHNLYADAQCTTPAKNGTWGVASLTGGAASLSNWNYSSNIDSEHRIYFRSDIVKESGIVLGGVNRWFSFQFPAEFPDNSTAILSDRVDNGGSTLIKNAFFTNTGYQPDYDFEGGRKSFCIQFYGDLGWYEPPTDLFLSISFFYYQEKPDGNRTQWRYFNRDSDYNFMSLSFSKQSRSQFSNVGFYRCTVENKQFIMIACGFNDSGEFQPQSTYNYGLCILVPEYYFKDISEKPYIGPVSKDSAESSFIPDRGLIHDSIASRDLTGKRNPYGFNSGALKLCKLTNTSYGLLCAQIFNGSSGSILNQISQDVAAITGGNEHRNHEEVQAIQAGIMKIHLIPDITTIPTGAPYNISTIAGYKISGLVPVPAVPITDSMLVYNTPSVRILRTWKSYIDYEPYTTITLRIPYVGNINIPPSIIYDNAVSLTYHLDLFSGTLSVDIIIHDYTNGNSYIFSTLQANCAVSLPIAGTAAAGAPLLKIASGLLGVAMSGVGSSANNIFSVISGLQDTKKSVPFGNFAQSNISAYFDSRHCYAIIQSVNPSNAETFLTDKGYVAHLSGIINDFAGSGTEMHCRFESVDLTGLSKLTEQEKQEVESMLKAGVHIRKV